MFRVIFIALLLLGNGALPLFTAATSVQVLPAPTTWASNVSDVCEMETNAFHFADVF